jgi:hypothetical protein
VVGVGAVGFLRGFGSVLCVVVGALAATTVARAQCVLPHALVNGQPADAAQVMANYNALLACLTPGGSTNAIQYNAGSGNLGGVGPLTDGQLVIGSTGNAPQAQTLTAGTGIAITNAPGSVTIAATAGPSVSGLYRQVMSATPTSASTGLTNWLNQGTSVVSDSPVGVTIDAPSVGTALSLVGRYGVAPTPPYTIKALLGVTRNTNSYNGVYRGWYDGTAKLHIMHYQSVNGGASAIGVGRWSSATSYVTGDFQSANNAFSQPIWFQIQDDGTNVSFAFSQDGANFLPVYSVAKASGYLGATGYSNLIFIVDPRGTSRTLGTVMSWTQN